MLYLLLIVLPLIAYFDWQKQIIPNGIVFPAIAGVLVYQLICSRNDLPGSLFSLAILFVFGMTGIINMGDLKLWMLLAITLGFLPSALVLLCGLVLLTGYALIKEPKDNLSRLKFSFKSVYLGLKQERIGKRYPIGVFVCIAAYPYIIYLLLH